VDGPRHGGRLSREPLRMYLVRFAPGGTHLPTITWPFTLSDAAAFRRQADSRRD